ncbi:hypothetical protein FACS189494_02190 [Spirochaetia bacterium]|nr:hypothetical protein FACS189494_02190 [Spirochaetia bacterium]
MKNINRNITIVSFVSAVILIAVFIILPEDFFKTEKKEFRQSKTIVPAAENVFYKRSAEYIAAEEAAKMKITLEEGENAISSLSEDFDGDSIEEQVILYRNILKNGTPLFLTYIDYNEDEKKYKRIWSEPTPVTQHGTSSLWTTDLIGDRSVCILVSGMNTEGQHTLTVLRLSKPDQDSNFSRIAQIKIDGAISIMETERTQAYQLGIANGVSFDIQARGKDSASRNDFDQVEITYSYNTERNQYVQKTVTHIPGSQLAAKQLRDLLGGGKTEFEQFVDGLWYHVTDGGSIDNDRYVYFNTLDREIIFYDENTQQVYNWLNSTSTRYGLYVSSQNISVATLRRIMDIELESIDSIRIKVFEDVRMKIGINAPWDGSYRKASSIKHKETVKQKHIDPYTEGEYISRLGMIKFFLNGDYTLDLNGTVKQGKYVFFMLEDEEILNLTGITENSPSETYRVMRNKDGEAKTSDFSIERIGLTTRGMQEYHEAEIQFTREN